jgi:tRNA(Ile)-lysidine synthetase-like protein
MALSGGLSELEEAVCRAIDAIDPGPLAVALSGGADSAIAAWACVTTRPVGSVRAIHVDHGWASSADLRQAAVAIADHLDIPVEVVTVQPDDGASPEGAARDARLSALLEAARGDRVVTGHHADDAVETVIGNLLRGAGLTGLSGIAAERFPFVRPLVRFRRSELRRVAERLQLPFVDDPSNADITLRRNLIRHDILPTLGQHIEGDLAEIVGRSAAHLASSDAFLEDVTPTLTVKLDEDALLVAIAPLLTTPPVLAQRAVRKVLRAVHPPYPGTSREVEAVLAVAHGARPRSDLSDRLIVEREGPYVAFYRPRELVAPGATELPLPGGLAFGLHTITTSAVPTGVVSHMSYDRCRVSLVEPNLRVRIPERGDTIEIEGGSKTVSDALSEAAIPVRKRLAWPVVEHRGTIVWVAGVRVAAWARKQAPGGAWIELERRST